MAELGVIRIRQLAMLWGVDAIFNISPEKYDGISDAIVDTVP